MAEICCSSFPTLKKRQQYLKKKQININILRADNYIVDYQF